MNRYLALQKIVELKSFSKAAESLGYTQSAISQIISSLENELSIKLLNRNRNGVSLTDEGTELYPYIEQTIAHYIGIQEKAKEIIGLDSGSIKLGTNFDISSTIIPKILQNFKKKYPMVDISIFQDNSKSLDELLKLGRVDFIFTYNRANKKNKYIHLLESELKLVLPKDHKFCEKQNLEIKDLKNEYIMTPDTYFSDTDNCLNEIIQMANTDIKDGYTITKMVENKLGIGLLSDLFLKNNKFDFEIKSFKPNLKVNLYISYRDRLALNRASKILIEYIKNK